ncbi:phosphoglucomutase/phosphomannomutase family protein [Halorientalis marina]|uniref:phosphoglucomutase/phosphomannomutase family protein n=1 Tax=Halorientalis marina TaxID=2931976 RepID=UPI001FF43798|nr:phosphoglucomutase/phosphomannomutase family protein [Halorientalis marina]
MEEVTFGTDGWRATLETFTDRRVRIVGQAVATYLRDEGTVGTVGIGYDAREHSRGFAEELARVLCANGFDVLLSDRDCPTPALAWTVRDRDLVGGLVLTASHNPPEYNGIKFVPADGTPALPDVTDAIETRLAEPENRPEDEHGSVTESDLIGPYVEHLQSFVGVDLDGLPVVYDAMHGSGRGVTDRLLDAAGAEVERLRCEQDPEFGGSPPEPSAERLDELVERVRESEAALGIANDGDADRIGVVTPQRGVLDPSLFFAAVYDYLLETNEGSAVRTVSTSSIVDRVAEAHGESVAETPVGFKWVAEAMGETGALMGGEESGGFGVAGHLRNKDGVCLALLSAAATAAESLDDRVDRLEADHGEIHQDRVSVDCPDERKAGVVADLDGALPDEIAGSAVERVNDVDGFKIFLADGSWLLVRPSGTEPKLRVYAEATSDARVAELLTAGREIVEPLV